MAETVARKRRAEAAPNTADASLADAGRKLTAEELEALEDLEDVRIYQERKHDPRQPFEDFLREEGLDGPLPLSRSAGLRLSPE